MSAPVKQITGLRTQVDYSTDPGDIFFIWDLPETTEPDIGIDNVNVRISYPATGVTSTYEVVASENVYFFSNVLDAVFYGTTITFEIRSKNADGVGPWSLISYKKDFSSDEKVSAFSVSQSNPPTLTWTSGRHGGVSFEIWRVGNNESMHVIDTIPWTGAAAVHTYQDTSLGDNPGPFPSDPIRYNVRLKTADGVGVFTLPSPIYNPPAVTFINLTGEHLPNGNIQLSWAYTGVLSGINFRLEWADTQRARTTGENFEGTELTWQVYKPNLGSVQSHLLNDYLPTQKAFRVVGQYADGTEVFSDAAGIFSKPHPGVIWHEDLGGGLFRVGFDHPYLWSAEGGPGSYFDRAKISYRYGEGAWQDLFTFNNASNSRDLASLSFQTERPYSGDEDAAPSGYVWNVASNHYLFGQHVPQGQHAQFQLAAGNGTVQFKLEVTVDSIPSVVTTLSAVIDYEAS